MGWAWFLVKLTPFISFQANRSKGFLLAKNPEYLYQELGYPIRVLLTAALLEIAHAAAKLVRSSPWVTAQQVLGYFFCLNPNFCECFDF